MATIQDVIGDYTPLSNNVVKRLKLVRGAIACKVFFTSNLEDRVCRKGQTRIAKELGLEVSTVSKGLKWLVDNKYIEQTQEHTPTEPTHYRCTNKFYQLAKGIDLINPPIDVINTPIDLINQEEESEEELKEDMVASDKTDDTLDEFFPRETTQTGNSSGTQKGESLVERIKRGDPALQMLALGVTAKEQVSPGIKLIEAGRWNIGSERIKAGCAAFIEATDMQWLPATPERGKWTKCVKEQLEEFSLDELPTLYRQAWKEYEPQILAGTIDITHPGALTNKMRAIKQRGHITPTNGQPKPKVIMTYINPQTGEKTIL